MMDHIAVDDGYRHVAKTASPGGVLVVGSSRLKWYDVARAETPVQASIRDMARGFLEAEARGGALGLERDVGFAILHRCGASNDFYFLLLCSWRNANELWESVYFKDGDGMAGFAPFVQTSQHRGTYCVWELGPIVHERKAWVRFLNSARGEGDLRDYFGSAFAGEV